MDEVLSNLLITDPSAQHMNAAIVSGMDANPPLFPNIYWGIGHLISTNTYFLRSVSIGIFATTIGFYYVYVNRLIRAPATNFLLILAVVATTYLNFTLATQIRSYSLFLAVALFYFVCAHRLLLKPDGIPELLLHTAGGVLLVFTHNFGLFYLAATGLTFAGLSLFTRGRFSLAPLLSFTLIVGAWSWLWLPSFLIQARAGDPHSWIPLPTWRTLFAVPGELAPAFSARLERLPGFWIFTVARVCALPAVFAYLLAEKMRQGFAAVRGDPAFLFYFLSGVLHVGTLLISLATTFAATSVFLSRYLWPSQLLVMFQIIYIWHRFVRRRGTCGVYTILTAAAAAGLFIFYQNRKIIIFPRGIVSYLQALPASTPVFVETADYFLPLSLQKPGLPVHYILDWESAVHPGNLPSATVESQILKSVRDFYHVRGIETLSQFNARRFPDFFVVDESAVYQFERFIKSGALQVSSIRPVAVAGHQILECHFRPTVP